MSALIDYKTESPQRIHYTHQHFPKLQFIQPDIWSCLCAFSDGRQKGFLRGSLLTHCCWLQHLSNDSRATYWRTRACSEGFPGQEGRLVVLSLRHICLSSLEFFVKEFLEPVEEDEVVLKFQAYQAINIHTLVNIQFCEGGADYFEVVQAVRFLFRVKLHSGDWNLPWEEDVEELTIGRSCPKLFNSPGKENHREVKKKTL